MKMFWGLVLEPGKKHEQVAESSFHLTMAALELPTKTPTPNKSSVTSVLLQNNGSPIILCHLDPQRVLQQPLDCVFTEGEPIVFSVNGDAKVHLSGYIMPDSDIEDSEDMFDLESDSDSEAELMNAAEKKRKLVADSKDGNKKVKFGDELSALAKGNKQEKAKQPAKGAKNDAQVKGNQKAKPANLGIGDEDDDDDDDEDESMDSEDMKDLLGNFDSDDDEDGDEDDDDEEDDEESSPEAKKPVAKPQPKQQNQKATPAKGQPGKQEGPKNQNQNQTPQGKKPFQQGSGGKPWSGGKGGNKGGPNPNFNKNQNSGKKGTPQQGKKFGGNSPGNKKPWAQKK